jgi:cystathionine beta-synthase
MPAPAPVSSVLDLIGNTPVIRVHKLDTGKCELYLKLESQNPGGSIKDRIAMSMISAAEKSGQLKPGGTMFEATAGNTGLALALVANLRGYHLTLVIPDKMSQEKIFHLRAMGAEVIITRSDVTKGHPEYYQDKARALAEKTPGGFYVSQFENPANPAAHEATTAPEIWEQMEHNVDAIVCGSGTGGTLTGVGRYFKKVSPTTEMVLADPKGSVLAPYVEHGVMPQAGGRWLVEGIGSDYIGKNVDLSLVKKAFSIPDEESIGVARELLLKEGILCGSSTGTLVAAALRYARAQTTKKRIVTFVCDTGSKYLSRIYNPYWLQDNGLMPQTEMHDLRDLIARPYAQGKVISVSPSDTLQQVYAKMKMYDVSQVPVIDHGKVLGIADEADVLMAVMGNAQGFGIRVGAAMTDKLATIKKEQAMTDLLPIFERGRVACVLDGETFLGLITPIDFLNYMRKRTGNG